MAYRALSPVLLGVLPPVQSGDPIPDTYVDLDGNEQPVNFDRLVELGVAEKTRARSKKSDD